MYLVEGKILVDVMMSWLSSMPIPSEGSDAPQLPDFVCFRAIILILGFLFAIL